MFSSHLPKINTLPREYLYAGAGLLLVVCLLAALAAVASGEVKKASMRDSVLASQRSAMAYCVETLRGSALDACMFEARSTPVTTADRTAVADNSSAASGRSSTLVPAGTLGFTPVAFSVSR